MHRSHGRIENAPVMIYGAGVMGKKLAAGLSDTGVVVRGFLDCQGSQDKKVMGLPCQKPEQVSEKNLLVIIAVFNRESSLIQIIEDLTKWGFHNVMTMMELTHHIPSLKISNFWFSSQVNYQDYVKAWPKIDSIWSDTESKDLFSRSHKFRQSGILSDYVVGEGFDHQYFPMDIISNEVVEGLRFLDCGAYNGDTIDAIFEHGLNLEEAIAFEPGEEAFQLLSLKIKNYEKSCVRVYQLATWSSNTELFFNDDGTESSRISETGISVPAVSLDSFIPDYNFNYIKIDVEGADLETLKGAINLLKTNRPFIAVSVYHVPDHLYSIPRYLFNQLEGYDFYLRQYGHNGFETVLYCKPKNKRMPS